MKLTGQELIAAPRAAVWDALNDPDVLRQCIPGCQSLERESAEKLRATVEIKIGPIGARFNGAVTLSDIDPQTGYTITGEGQGGTVGFAKGGAKVQLADAAGGTMLTYDVDAQVGGRLAQLGGPIIDATAKQLAGKFFAKLGQVVVGGTSDGVAPVPAGSSLVHPAAEAQSSGGLPIAWVLAVALAALIGFLVGRHFASPVIVLDADLLARLAAVRRP
jgi:carbon monoxide dehydrogenase subunit G